MNEKKVVEIKVDDILPNRFQPRLKFNETAIQELSDSIKEHGVIQPIVVRKIADKYEIIAGERRYKASVMAGKETIPAIITDLSDNESAEVALIENVQRQNLTPIEEAISYKKILDMGFLTQDVLASKLGKTQSTVANKLRLLNLEEEVQEALLNGLISERHARSLLKLTGKNQVDLLDRIIKERLTVRATDLEVEKILHPKQETTTTEVNDIVKNENVEKPIQPFNFESFINNSPKIDEDVAELNIPTNPIIEDEVIVNKMSPSSDFSQNLLDLNKNEEKSDLLFQNSNINGDLDDFTPTPIVPSKIFDDNDIKEPLNIETNDLIDIPITVNNEKFDDSKQNDSNKFFNFDLIDEEEPQEIDLEEKDEEEKSENIETPFNYNDSPFTFSPVNPIKIEEDKKQDINIDEKIIEPIIFEPLNIEELYTPKVRYDGIKYSPKTSSNNDTSSNIRTVINTIRSCADTVKKFGYNVDVQENDYDNFYKITFEIKKN